MLVNHSSRLLPKPRNAPVAVMRLAQHVFHTSWAPPCRRCLSTWPVGRATGASSSTQQSDRRAKLLLLEQERDGAIQLDRCKLVLGVYAAQACSKRSKRLLARVQQLTSYAELRQKAGDTAAVEATLKTKAQVQDILNKTINRAQNNYNLASRLEDIIGSLQQQLSQPGFEWQVPMSRRGLARQPSGTSVASAALSGVPAEAGTLPPGRLAGLLNGSIDDMADTAIDEFTSEAGVQQLDSPGQQGAPEANSTTPEPLRSADFSSTAWTSYTMASVDTADWGMQDVDWLSRVDPGLVEALTGRQAGEVQGQQGEAELSQARDNDTGEGDPVLTEEMLLDFYHEEHAQPVSDEWLRSAREAAYGVEDVERTEENQPAGSAATVQQVPAGVPYRSSAAGSTAGVLDGHGQLSSSSGSGTSGSVEEVGVDSVVGNAVKLALWNKVTATSELDTALDTALDRLRQELSALKPAK